MSRIVSQLAARLELLSSSLLELIAVGPHRPVAQFRREPLVNGIYVVHAPHGAILLAGLMLESDDAALQGTRADRIDALGSGGFASTYRVVDLGTVDLARQLGRIIFDLFGGAFPLSQDKPAGPAEDFKAVSEVAVVPEAAPTFRKRVRPRSVESPGKAPAEAPVTDAVETPVEGVVPAVRKRGRPPKNAVPPSEATPQVATPQAAAPVESAGATGADNRPASNGNSAPAEPGNGEPSRTINSGLPAATIVAPDDVIDTDSSSDNAPSSPNGSHESENADGIGGPMLQMTKNQRREKRRRELAQLLRGGEG